MGTLAARCQQQHTLEVKTCLHLLPGEYEEISCIHETGTNILFHQAPKDLVQ